MAQSETEKKKAHILQLAWAGGVFDGKTTFPTNGYVVRFETTDESVVKRFHQVVGVGNIFPRNHKQTKYPVWVYQTTTADDTRELMLMLSPFFSASKLKKAGELVAKIERLPLWRKKHPEKAALLDTDPAA